MSLRVKVIVGVLVIDCLIFGFLAYFIPLDLRQQAERDRQTRGALSNLIYNLASTLPETSEQGPNLATILSWPHWSFFADVLLMEGQVARLPGEEPIPIGLFINPNGRYERSVNFDYSQVKQRIAKALDSNQVIEEDNTITVPFVREANGGKVSWGCYFVLRQRNLALLSTKGILTLMLLSMLLLAFVTYFALSKIVIGPVEHLAQASKQVAAGDFTVVTKIPKSRDELADLVRSFDEMLLKLRDHQAELKREVASATQQAKRAERDLLMAQRLASLGTLAAGVAHEINNPLAGMINAIHSLRTKPLSKEKQDEYLALVSSGLERVRGTVHRILQFSPRRKEQKIEQVDLEKVLQTVEGLIAHRLRNEQVSLTWDLQPKAKFLLASVHELEQLFLNLFLNSLDAIAQREETPVPGKIQISSWSEGGKIWLRVEDNGAGMAADLAVQAFDPFFTTKEVGTGTGLGLSIVYSIVRGAGGKVELSSQIGKGFQVIMQFPAAEA